MRLFLVYAEGNFIEASEETPFFQIGETKYGKPIIDRVIRADTPIVDAIKCILVSFDSTMRSNLSVGLPIDLACYKQSDLRLELQQHITDEDPYFSQISRRWSDGLRGVFASLPNPDWLIDIDASSRLPPP
jgi:putative proteasome-type protease